MEKLSMLDVMQASGGMSLLRAAMLLVLMVVGLRFFDWLSGMNWRKDVFNVMQRGAYPHNSLALSVYYSSRMLAVAIALGLAVNG